ncbi:MAG: HNH endonuclease, partial [Pseudobdellovibrionaceae bacterium]
PIKDNQVQITLTLSQEQYEELKEAQDYLSNKVRSLELKDYLLYLTKKVLQQKGPVKSEANTSNSTTRQTAASANTTHPDLSASTAINTTAISAARTTLDKEQPLEKRKTIVQMQVVSTKNLAPDKAKELEQQQLLTEATAIPAADLVKVEEAEKTETLAVAMEVGKSERALVVRQRPYISKSLKAEVFRAADFQCQYVCKDSQKRCEATNFLQVDHIQPIALDGTNSKDNLRVYCQADNHLAAVESGLMKAV